MPDSIYARPADYDLEHDSDEEDVRFYRRLVTRLKPGHLLELGCGSGRVTLPLAESAARDEFELTGVDLSPDMLAEAGRKLSAQPAEVQARVRLLHGDILEFAAPGAFDLIIVPCSTLSHVLDLDDQLRVWRRAYENLRPGGRFVVDLAMPNLTAFADSMQTPPRVLVEMDIDSEAVDGRRLLRYKTTFYEAHLQRARVHFLYDRFEPDEEANRYVSDFESHVYYPREVELLFRVTGFTIEAVFGDYRFGPFRSHSRDLIMIGTRPAN